MITLHAEVTCNGCGKSCGPGLVLNADGTTDPSIENYLLLARNCGWTVDGTALWCQRCIQVLPPRPTEHAVKGRVQ